MNPTPLNKLLHTSRRHPTALSIGQRFRCGFYAQPFLPAAVGEHLRSAESLQSLLPPSTPRPKRFTVSLIANENEARQWLG